MNSIPRIRRAVESPVLLLRQANRLYHRRFGTRQHNTDGADIFEDDWDNGVILDACRYDMFARCSNLPGELSFRRSKGSATPEFLRANVHGRELRDTVYVTSNPMLYREEESIDHQFHDVIQVWKEDGWDTDSGTVLPETVTEYAIEAAETYPHKRLLIHYMQPHYPFIDSRTTYDKAHLTGDGGGGKKVWEQIMTGTLSADRGKLWRMYEDNLKRVLPSVETIIEELHGRTVVTADHGNMIGERSFPIPIKEWGHPRGTYTDELVEVPWLVSSTGSRRTIKRETTTEETSGVDSDVVANRLQHLGYAE